MGSPNLLALDLFRLRVFVTVVERNGYSAAARHLHLAQPTVSHHVAELEKALGSDLLRYEQRAIHLTPAGQEVYNSALLMLREQESLQESLKDLKHGRRGRVRLGASIAFEQRYFLDQVIVPFCRSHQGTLLSLRFGHSGQYAQAVLDREVDLAYVIKWQLPPEVSFEPLHKAPMRFLVPRSHPLARQETVDIEDIAEAGLIASPLTSLESMYYRQILRESGIIGEHSVIEVDGMQARVLAAEAGLGVVATFIPPYARGSVMAPLVELSVNGPTAQVQIGLVRRPADKGPESVDALADWLRRLTSA
ncbi:transcriptional regulator [Sinomonas cellulolyticus]|uniref:LysR family transcriptional regulator n=1 Tax=Sinomonas cellulolyticus TaxID=2801916 RepID=A0ABS1K6A1_9MICC|nr:MULTISPECIES: LysR family transcriptional regulator [Sinomonas]MBL0707209.1 LysR family transcriptional regulator [Sinomonas cellulolyticus]GHG50049.1 transcriptional regulator [Sinomonas sp. KCTC 49339]